MTVPDSVEQPPMMPAAREDELFPTLTPEQLERLAVQGQRRRVVAGEVLHDGSEHISRFFVVVDGRIEVLAGEDFGERIVSLSRPGQFTGELNVLSGRRGFVRVRAATDARGRRGGSRAPPVDRSDRRRAERNPDAGVHPAASGADRARPRRRRPDRLDPLGRHAARPGVPDPQQPSVHLRRSRIARRTSSRCSIASTSRLPTSRS